MNASSRIPNSSSISRFIRTHQNEICLTTSVPTCPGRPSFIGAAPQAPDGPDKPNLEFEYRTLRRISSHPNWNFRISSFRRQTSSEESVARIPWFAVFVNPCRCLSCDTKTLTGTEHPAVARASLPVSSPLALSNVGITMAILRPGSTEQVVNDLPSCTIKRWPQKPNSSR